MRRPKLPTRVLFPGGFICRVNVVSKEELGEDNAGEYGTVSEGEGRIDIWDHATPRQQWEALLHEMLHALADAQRLIHNRAKRGELG